MTARIIGNILGHYSAGTDSHIAADGDTGQYCDVGADHRVFPDMNVSKPVFIYQILMGQYYSIITDYTILSNVYLLRMHQVRHRLVGKRYLISHFHLQRFAVQKMSHSGPRRVTSDCDENKDPCI